MVKVNFLCENDYLMTIDPESKSDSLLFLILIVCLIILLMAIVVIHAPNLFG